MTSVKRYARRAAAQPVEIACTIRRVTEKSLAIFDGTTEDCVSKQTGETYQRERWIHLPLKFVSDAESDEPGPVLVEGKTVRLTIPEWLAKDRGLI